MNYIDTPLVSILIPLYNAEKYLSKCLDSVIGQTYKNFEIIIVNDGSTDNSLEAANRYAKKYSYIKVYSQNNSGAASARNKAFALSLGDYIQYFDADDIMDPEKIASQIKALKEYNFDPMTAAIGRWARLYGAKGHIFFPSLVIYHDYNDTLAFLRDSWLNAHYCIGQSWLISRMLHEEAEKWDQQISVLDDGVFFAKVAYCSKRIIFVSESILYWRQDSVGSLSKNISKKGMQSHLAACDRYADIVENDLDYPGMRQALASEYSKFIYTAYPNFPDLTEKATKSINSLGYESPPPLPTWKFRFSQKFIGYYPTVVLFHFKKYLFNYLMIGK